jgi:redox-sensitive bicupin YhaK (pirin superfamily)
MEIISYVLEGTLEHRDNMGNGSVIRPGEVQRMSAGTGVVHSEFNASNAEPVHFLQVWIIPDRAGLQSSYEQKFFAEDEKRGRLRLVASPDGAAGSVRIQQDARIYATLVGPTRSVEHTIARGRKGWLQVARGSAIVNGTHLEVGDGLAIEGEEQLTVGSNEVGELLLFDMAAQP